jgi:hypothetical protein
MLKYYFSIINYHISIYIQDEPFKIQMKLMKQGLLKSNTNLINLPLLVEIVTILENVFSLTVEECFEIIILYLECFYS